MAPTPTSITLGALVACADERLASQFGLAGTIGIVAEARKRDARAIFLEPDRSVWIPNGSLRPATEGERAASPLALVGELLRKLGGKELELRAGAAGSLEVIIGHGSVTPDLIDEIRAGLGSRLAGWRLRPAGLSKIQSLMEISAPAI